MIVWTITVEQKRTKQLKYGSSDISSDRLKEGSSDIPSDDILLHDVSNHAPQKHEAMGFS